MTKQRKHRLLYIILSILLLLVAGAGGFAMWISYNYKELLRKHIPPMIAEATDSMYHISYRDVKVSMVNHSVTILDARFWPDSNQINNLRREGRYIPNTVSTVFAPKIEISGIEWNKFIAHKLITATNIKVYHPTWYLETRKHHPDLSMLADRSSPSMINRFAVGRIEAINPDFTYRYIGDSNNYTLYLKGGNTVVNDWAVDQDINKDTSTILYAKNGSVRPDSVIFKKDGKDYYAKSPVIDFVTSANSVTLKDVRIKHFADVDRESGNLMEIYNFHFPAIELVDFNWKKLLHFDVLMVSHIYAREPGFGIHYIREVASAKGKQKTGSFPNQLIHEAINMYIGTLHIENGKIHYTEPIKKSDSLFVLHFDDLNGTFTNITNINSRIAQNKNCLVKLKAKYMGKSPVAATFDLSLSDPKGHFSVAGFIDDLQGDDVSKQASAFTFAKVTSFHLTRMEGHVEGDESYATGNFKMLYENLKISLFKFKSDDRKSKKGPFAFLADATILYPDNPMPGKDTRTASTIIHRDPTGSFIYLIWQNMYLAAQKTAVRDERIIDLAGGKTDRKDNPPQKEGLFKRIFGKKKDKS
jgi:hypothetical protein